jgi:hypothetical protein
MNYYKDPYDDDITLIDTIRNISDRISLNGSKQDNAHSEFLLEMIEDMSEQVESIKYYRKASSGV